MPARIRIGLLLVAWTALTGCNKRNPSASQLADSSGAASVTAHDDRLQVEVSVAPHPVQLSDEPTLTLTLTYDPTIKVTAPPFADAIGDFQIIDQRPSLPESKDGRKREQFTLILEPLATGKLFIEPIDIEYKTDGDPEPHLVTTEAFEVEVATVIDTERPSLDDLSAMHEPVGLAARTPWLLWGTGILLFGLLAFVAVWVYRRRATTPDRALSPWEAAERDLAGLMETSLMHANVKQFYVELTGIVRRFLEATTSVDAPDQTTEEFLREIQTSPEFNHDQRSKLQAFLESADLVKYAAHVPSEDDINMSCVRAREFIGARQETNFDESGVEVVSQGGPSQ